MRALYVYDVMSRLVAGGLMCVVDSPVSFDRSHAVPGNPVYHRVGLLCSSPPKGRRLLSRYLARYLGYLGYLACVLQTPHLHGIWRPPRLSHLVSQTVLMKPTPATLPIQSDSCFFVDQILVIDAVDTFLLVTSFTALWIAKSFSASEYDSVRYDWVQVSKQALGRESKSYNM